MNKSMNSLTPKNGLLRPFHYVVIPSLIIFSITLVPALADPFANMFEDAASLSENEAAKYQQNTSGDIFDAALNSYIDVDTSSVDVMIAKLESQSQEQAFNSEVIWETETAFEHSRTNDRSESIIEEENNKIVRTSIALEKTLWDKALDHSIDSARNNIKTAQLNRFVSQHELVESVALAYLDFLEAKDLAASSQNRHVKFLNLRNKIRAKKASGDTDDIDMEEVESQIKTARSSLLEERNNLKKANVKLHQLTNNSNIYINSKQSYFTGSNNISLSSEANLIRMAMKNNTELRALRSGEVSLHKNILSKRAETSPKLGFTSSISQEWSSGDTDLDTFDVSVGLNMKMPLYTGGRNRNQVKLAKLELLSAERETNQKKREIRAEISTLKHEFSRSLSSYKSLLRLHKQLKKRIAEVNSTIASDGIKSIDVFSELDDEVELNNSVIRQYYSLLKTKVEIMKITGELDRSNLNNLRALLLTRRS